MVGPSTKLQQIIQKNITGLKILNWPEANHLASHKRDPEFEVMQDYREQIQLTVRTGLELGAGVPSLSPLDHTTFLFATYLVDY